MATATTSPKPAGKGNLIVTLGALTVLAAVGGGIVGKLIVARLKASPAVAETVKGAPAPPDLEVRELPPIITNLAQPADMRVRLQVAIVYPKKEVEAPNVLAAQIGDDLVAFMKTLSLGEIQGASGLQNLREDLNERAVVRSQGKIRELVIEALVVQ